MPFANVSTSRRHHPPDADGVPDRPCADCPRQRQLRRLRRLTAVPAAFGLVVAAFAGALLLRETPASAPAAVARPNASDAPVAPQVPADDNPPAKSRDEIVREVRAAPPAELTEAVRAAWRPETTLSGRWRHIIVHHTATKGGRAESFDRYHRENRKMPNGLAYHFLIGNGDGLADGAVHVSRRWREQLDGGHVRGEELNRVAIGIALVGDFTGGQPTAAQTAALKTLLNYLLENSPALDEKDIHGHGGFNGQSTLCPGDRFPLRDLIDTRLAGEGGSDL